MPLDRLTRRLLLVAAGLSAATQDASAATLTWNGGAGGWGDASAWTGLTWTSGDDAILAGTASAAVTVSGTQTLTSLTFSQTMSVTGGTLSFGTGAAAIAVGSGYTGSIASTLSGNGLTKTGAGTLVVTGAGSFGSGTIAVSAGTLSLSYAGMAYNNSGGWGGNAITVASGATLRLASDFNAGYSRSITLTGGTLNTTSGAAGDGNQYVNNLTLNSGASVTGNALRMGYHSNGVLTIGGSSASTMSAGLVLVKGGTYGVTFAVADATSSTATDFTLSGSITDYSGLGGTAVTKTGAGTMRLSASNSFSGGVTVSAGTLELAANAGFDGANGAIGTGNLTIASGATVTTLNGFAISGVSGSGNTRVVNVSGTLNLADSEYVRTYNLTAGTLNGPTGTNMFIRSSGAGMAINSLAAATTSTVTGKVDLTFGSLTLDVADGAAAIDLTISAPITQNSGAGSGAKTLTKTGSGTLLLSGANSFAGNVAVNAGTIAIGNQNALGAYVSGRPVTQVVVASGATVDFNGKGDATYGYTISGTGVSGAGALVNNGSGIGNGIAQASNITLAADATIGGTGNWALLTNSFNATTLDLAGKTLTKVGTNTVSLVNSTVTAGNIRISAGGLALAQTNSSLASVALTLDNVSGASFQNTGNFAVTLGSLAGGGATGGTVDIGSGSLNVGGLGASTSYGGAITGSGSLTKSGNGLLTLSGASTYSGGTTLSAGAIAIGSNSALGSSAGAVTVSSAGGLRSADTTARSLANNLTFSTNATLGDATANGALTFTGTAALGAARTLTTASDVTFSGVVSGGSLTKLGNGRLTLGAAAHTFTGDLTVSAGSLGITSGASWATSKFIMANGTSIVAGSGYTVGSGKQLQLGASGSATVGVTGNFTLGGGTLLLDIDGAGSDLLNVTGDVNLSSGTLAFSPAGGSYASGTYAVLGYTGTLSGLGTVTTSGLVSSSSTSRLSFTLTDVQASKQLQLLVGGSSATMRWTGAVDATWDAGLGGVANWSAVGSVASGASDRFYDLDAVNFDDTGANRTVSVGSALTVGTITLSNATTDYAFSGAGSVGGLATIAKSGAGAVDLNVAYTGSGGVSVSGGTLRLQNAGFAPGTGATIAVSGGRLEIASGVTLGSAPLSITGGTVSVLSSAALGAGNVTLDGGTLELAALGTYSKSFTVGASGGTLSAKAAGTTTVSPAIASDGSLTLSASANAVLYLNGALSGSGSVTKAGAGNANLGAAATYTGNTTVSEGLLVVQSTLGSGASYAGAISVASNAILSLASSSNQTLSGAISGAGSIAKSYGGTLTLSSANTGFTGVLSVYNATLSLGHSQAAGSATIALDNATLSRNAANTTVANAIAIGSGGATIAGRQDYAGYTDFSGAVSGSGNLNVDGLVQLSGSNSFTGKVTFADSDTYLRLVGGSPGALSSANLLEFTTGHLRVDGVATDVTYTIGGLSSNQAGHVFATSDSGVGAGHNVVLADAVSSGTRTFGGYFDRNATNNFRFQKTGAGTQVLNRAAGNGSGIAQIIVTGGVLELAGNSVAFNTGYFSGSQAFAVSGGATLRVSQAWNLATGNSVALDGGTLDVTNSGNYLNTLSLAGGSTASGGFRLGNTGNGSIISTGNATNTVSAALQLVNVGGRTVTFNVADGSQADDLVVSGAISDLPMDVSQVSYAGTVVSKTGAGTMVLSGASTFAGNLSVGAGALRVTGTLGGGSYAGAIAIAGALGIQSSSDQTLSGLISGSGALVKSGVGILTVSGANTGFSGSTLITDGTLRVGNVNALGTGTIYVNGGYLDLNSLNLANGNIVIAGGSLLNASAWAPASVTITGSVSADTLNAVGGSSITLGAGAVVDLSGVTKAVTLTGAATVDLGSYAGTLTIGSGGTLDLSSLSNRPTGNATIALGAGGTLALGSTAYAGAVNYSGGAVTGSFSGDLNIVGTGVALTNANLPSGRVVVGSGASVAIGSGFSGNLRLAGGSLVDDSLNNFAGTLTVASGTTLDLDGAASDLVVNAANASIVLEDGATLKGTASVGSVTLQDGSILAPGNSPGTLTVGQLSLVGGTFRFEIAGLGSSLGGDPTAGVDYDHVVAESLDLSQLTLSAPYVIELFSLTRDNLPGIADGWNPAAGFTLSLFSYGSLSLGDHAGIVGLFVVNADAFLDSDGLTSVPSGRFSVYNDTVARELQLVYSAPVPEPSTYGIALGGLALVAAAIRRRRK